MVNVGQKYESENNKEIVIPSPIEKYGEAILE